MSRVKSSQFKSSQVKCQLAGQDHAPRLGRGRGGPMPSGRGLAICLLLCARAAAQFGNLEVKWATDESTGSKDAMPSMGKPDVVAKPDGQTRSTNLRSLTNERLSGIGQTAG